jgi:signal transduction histidine kinase
LPVRTPLQYQIMLPLAAVAIASLLAVGAINAWLATEETQASIDRQLQGVVRVLAASNFPLTDAVLRQMRDLSGAEFVLIENEGRQVSASLPALTDQLPLTDVVDASEKIVLGSQISLADKTYFHSAIQLKRPLEAGDSSTLHVLFPRERYDAAWRSAFMPPLVVGVIAVIAVGLVTQWISNRISRNLSRLGAGVQRLAGGEFAALELPARDDELRDLAVAVNQTATRLSEYEQHVRQTEQVRTVAMLGAGLAHEMRNAATGCRLAVDLHAENCQMAVGDDSLAVAKSQLQLMESRLRRFLQLGREQSHGTKLPLDLNQLVEELLPLVLPAARHARVAVDWRRANEETSVLADADSLGMVIVNLLLNAIEAAQKQATTAGNPALVSVSVMHVSSGNVELDVSDSGSGLTDSVAKNLFQPFVTTKAEGVGLGLAVAQQVAVEHGGEICWSRQQGQTRFRLSLPLVAKSPSLVGRGKRGFSDVTIQSLPLP